MRVAIPHQLPREEVRRRLRERSGEIADHLPGGMAQVETHWPEEDRGLMSVSAMGQKVDAQVEIEDAAVILTVQLPPMLSFMEPMIRGVLEEKGRKLLAPPR